MPWPRRQHAAPVADVVLLPRPLFAALKKQSRPPPWFTSQSHALQMHEPEDGHPVLAQHAPRSRSQLAQHGVVFDCDDVTAEHMQKSGSPLAGLHSTPPPPPP